MPNDVSRPSSIRIANLHQPVLVTDGDDQVPVARRVENGVGVGPIRIQVGPPGGIEVVKLIFRGFINLEGVSSKMVGPRFG